MHSPWFEVVGDRCLIKSNNKTSQLHILFCRVIQICDNDNVQIEKKAKENNKIRMNIDVHRRRTKKGQLETDMNIYICVCVFNNCTIRVEWERKRLVELIRCQLLSRNRWTNVYSLVVLEEMIIERTIAFLFFVKQENCIYKRFSSS